MPAMKPRAWNGQILNKVFSELLIVLSQFLLLLPNPDALLDVELHSDSPDLLDVNTGQDVVCVPLIALSENFSRFCHTDNNFINPDQKLITWYLRSFILKKCLPTPAMLVATHTPWIVSGGSSNMTLENIF